MNPNLHAPHGKRLLLQVQAQTEEEARQIIQRTFQGRYPDVTILKGSYTKGNDEPLRWHKIAEGFMAFVPITPDWTKHRF